MVLGGQYLNTFRFILACRMYENLEQYLVLQHKLSSQFIGCPKQGTSLLLYGETREERSNK